MYFWYIIKLNISHIMTFKVLFVWVTYTFTIVHLDNILTLALNDCGFIWVIFCDPTAKFAKTMRDINSRCHYALIDTLLGLTFIQGMYDILSCEVRVFWTLDISPTLTNNELLYKPLSNCLLWSYKWCLQSLAIA